MKKATILLGGGLTITERLRCQIKESFVIAADSGIKHAVSLKIMPDLWLGDFDSSVPDTYPQFQHVPRQSYSIDKDKTDGELAIEAALAKGLETLLLVGAFGGDRLDHIFCHMSQAVSLAQKGKCLWLTNGAYEATMILSGTSNRPQKFDYPPKTQFSILPFTDLRGLTIKGAKWPLEEVDVPFGVSLTLSNEVEQSLSLSLKQGKALLWANCSLMK